MDRCDHHICSIYLCFACDNILDLCPFCIRQIRHINDHICGFFGKTYHRILKAFAGKQSLNCNLLFGALCHLHHLRNCICFLVFCDICIINDRLQGFFVFCPHLLPVHFCLCYKRTDRSIVSTASPGFPST